MNVHRLITLLKQGDEAERIDAARQLGAEESDTGLCALINAFGDESWLVRETAVESILTRKSPARISSFLTVLRNENARVRNSAIEILKGLGSPATEALIEALKDDDENIVRYCSECLGDIGDSRAVEPLLEALDRTAGDVKYSIVLALGKLGNARAIKPLLACLKEDLWIQSAALEALGGLGDKAVIPDIEKLMESNLFLAAPAMEALGRIGALEAIPVVIKNLGAEDEETLTAAVKALVRIKQANQGGSDASLFPLQSQKINLEGLLNALGHTDAEVRGGAAILLGWLQAEGAITPLTRLLKDDDDDVCLSAGESLVRFGASSVEPLVSFMRLPEKRAKLFALQVLKEIGSDAVMENMVKLLEDESDVDLKVAYIRLLGTSGKKVAFNGLVPLLADEREEIRAAAVNAIAMLTLGKRERKRLMAMLAAAPSGKKRALLALFGKLGMSESLDHVKEMLTDSDSAVRQQAVFALAEIEGKKAVGSLPILLLGSEDPIVRQSAATALGRMNDQRGVEPLIYTAADADPRVRYQSLHSLGQLKDRRALDVLKKSLRDEVGAVRIAAMTSLAQISAEEMTADLIDLKSEEDDDVRHVFLELLAQGRGRPCASLFMEALKDPSWKVRESALKGLAKCGDAPSRDKIREMCEDSHILVRKRARELAGERP